MAERPTISTVIAFVAVIGVSGYLGRASTSLFPDSATVEKDEATGAAEAGKEGESAEKKGDSGQGGGPRVHPVDAEAVGERAMSRRLRMTGNLLAEHRAMVIAQRAGALEQTLVEVGDVVESDQLLAKLDQREARAKVRRFELEREKAQANFDRLQALLRRKLISEEEVERAGMDAKIAAQSLTEARLELRKGSVRAPFAGRVVKRQASAGEFVNQGRELFEIADHDPLLIYLHVPQAAARALRADMRVKIFDRVQAKAALGSGSKGLQFGGSIRRLHPSVDTTTGTVEVVVEVPGLPPGIRPGAFVDVEFTLGSSAPRLAVPRSAVIEGAKGTEVFVVTTRPLTAEEKQALTQTQKDGQKPEKVEGGDDEASKPDLDQQVASVERRRVDLGIEDRGFYEVLQGLKVGDRVVVAGQGNLEAGARIRDRNAVQAEKGGRLGDALSTAGGATP